MAKVVSILKLPNVTGYLLAGIIIGPSIFSLVPVEEVSKLAVISEAALSFIAYTIGSQLNIKFLKKTGAAIIIITLLESLGAVFIVDLAMIFIFKQSIPFSLILGAIAAATAPAATIMVIRQYNAKGPLVDTLIPVVAMDDAVGIIAFGVSAAIAQALSTQSGSGMLAKALFQPILDIFLALLAGFIIGIFLSIIGKRIRGEDNLLTFTIAAVFLSVGIASAFNLSALLCSMMVGATVSNVVRNSDRIISVVDRFTPPIFVAFFTIAGLDLKLSVLGKVGLIGVAYVVFRVIGKMAGSYVGARITNAPKVVQEYLGFTLIPQAGVAIGLAMSAERLLPDIGYTVKTIVLFATVIYELIGPTIAKMALTKAGEIKVE